MEDGTRSARATRTRVLPSRACPGGARRRGTGREQREPQPRGLTADFRDRRRGDSGAAWVLSPGTAVPGQSAGLPTSPQPQDCLQRPDQRAQTHCGAAPWCSHGQRPRPQCQGRGRLLCGWAGLSRRSLRQRGEETPRLPRREDRAGSSYRGDPDSTAHARGWPGPALGTLPAVRGHTTVPGPGPAEAVVGGPERPHHPVQATVGCPPRGR